MADYNSYTVVKLRDILRSRDLPVSGNKNVLIQRLENYDHIKQAKKGGTCGTIIGIGCERGTYCQYDSDAVDAAGICVEENKKLSPRKKISYLPREGEFPGGWINWRPIEDRETIKMVKSYKKYMEKILGKKFRMFVPLEYRSQVVAGVKSVYKIRTDQGIIYMGMFTDLQGNTEVYSTQDF